MNPAITVTPAAKAKIDAVRVKTGQQDACLRIALGGYVDLLEVREGAAYVELGGGCQGCAQVDVTLRQGIEVAIKAAVPQITEVIDRTDHAAGTNPYFQPAKKAS